MWLGSIAPTGLPGNISKRPRLGGQGFMYRPSATALEPPTNPRVAEEIAKLPRIDYETDWLPRSKKMFKYFDSTLTSKPDTGPVVYNGAVVQSTSDPFLNPPSSSRTKLDAFVRGYREIIKDLDLLTKFGLSDWSFIFVTAPSLYVPNEDASNEDAYGECYYYIKQIRLYTHRLMLLSDRGVFDVLMHELAHAICKKIEPFESKSEADAKMYTDTQGHDKTFLNIDLRIGGRGKAKLDLTGREVWTLDEMFADVYVVHCTAETRDNHTCFIDIPVGTKEWFDAADQIRLDARTGEARCSAHSKPLVYAYVFDLESAEDKLKPWTFVYAGKKALGDDRNRYAVNEELLRPLKRVADAHLVGLPETASEEEVRRGLRMRRILGATPLVVDDAILDIVDRLMEYEMRFAGKTIKVRDVYNAQDEWIRRSTAIDISISVHTKLKEAARRWAAHEPLSPDLMQVAIEFFQLADVPRPDTLFQRFRLVNYAFDLVTNKWREAEILALEVDEDDDDDETKQKIADYRQLVARTESLRELQRILDDELILWLGDLDSTRLSEIGELVADLGWLAYARDVMATAPESTTM